MEYDACSAAQKRLVGDVSTVKTPPSFFRRLNMDMVVRKKKDRKLLQFRFLSLTM